MKALTENIRAILVLFIVFCTMGYYYFVTLMQIKPDPDIKTAINTLCLMAVGYYFIASSSSATKDKTIQDMAKKQADK